MQIAETGPAKYHEEGEALQFVEAIKNLTAKGGGDCPELTFQGLQNALEDGPRVYSPLYVFTDATAKDATADNIEEVEELAFINRITVNFFIFG